MMGNRLTDVVKHLIIINVIVFFGATSLSFVPDLAFYPPWHHQFKPYQIMSHMFMHSGTRHLLFNMMGLYFLAPFVEKMMGPQKFLITYLAAGMGSLAAHLAMGYLGFGWSAVVGASGAVYGIMIAFAVYFPNMKLQLMFIPIDIKAKYLAIGLIAYDLFAGTTGMNTGIAHFAHLGGALMGYLMVLYWRKNP